MPSSQQISQLVVLRVKEGVNLENVTSRNPGPEVQAFIKLTDIIKSQKGFIRQFWGHEVEHPHLFAWSVDWESFELYAAFSTSEEHASFIAGLSALFDLDTTPPITLYTHVSDNAGATAAFRSPVTEVSFWTMPTRPDEATRNEIDEGSKDVLRDVQEIGKATGAAIGWVFDAVPKAIVSGKDSVCIYGVFGYASVDVHMQWRETPEAKKYGEPSDTVLPAVVVPGIDPKTGYFHVKFQEG